jgi:hypothetical protein
MRPFISWFSLAINPPPPPLKSLKRRGYKYPVLLTGVIDIFMDLYVLGHQRKPRPVPRGANWTNRQLHHSQGISTLQSEWWFQVQRYRALLIFLFLPAELLHTLLLYLVIVVLSLSTVFRIRDILVRIRIRIPFD